MPIIITHQRGVAHPGAPADVLDRPLARFRIVACGRTDPSVPARQTGAEGMRGDR